MAVTWLASSAPTDVPDKVTYAADVAPILNENCVACHRPGDNTKYQQ